VERSKPIQQRIVIALPHLLPGGAERTASELANFLVKQGNEVFILLMYKRAIFFNLHPNVKLIEPSWRPEQYGKFLNVFLIIFYLRKALWQTKPDVVFALGYILYTLIASVYLQTSVIISGRSSPGRVRFPNNKLLNFIYRLSHRILASRVNGVIAQTRQAAEMYQQTYKSPIRVIPNFLRSIQDYDGEKADQIVTVGRCDVEKGHQFLLTAFSKLNAPAWKLVLVGDGQTRADLESLAMKLRINDRVKFVGFQKEVDQFLSQSKIFAFTSLHEGFPNALLEAMATPLACVSFNCVAGPSDIIADGENGFLINVGDTEALTQRLQQLIDDEALRTRIEQNAASTKSKYAIDNVGKQYSDFFTEIINRRK